MSGGVYKRDDTLDIGAGMRADLMETLFAPHFLNSFLDWAGTRFSPEYFSVTVASFNRTAAPLCPEVGIIPEKIFISRETLEMSVSSSKLSRKLTTRM